MTLPEGIQTRASITPEQARVMLVGTPGAGKTTLAAAWAPKTTLIIDTQQGTTLLDGEHYVAHVHDWQTFTSVVNDLKGEHHYKTVVIDLIEDIWRFADVAHAGKNAPVASATDDWQRSIRTAEAMFRQTVGTLLSLPIGVWFISHAREKQDGNLTRYLAALDGKPGEYVRGACQFIFLAETLGAKRALHTQPTAKFEAKSRVPMPDPMELDARALYSAIAKGLKPPAPKPKPVKTEPEKVAA